MKVFMIISGESSGELYGSLLAKSLKLKYKDCRIVGIGGKRMEEAGVELISNVSEALGVAEILSSLYNIKKTFDKAVNCLEKLKPEVLILIDYPDFNIRLASIAKSMGIKVLYYVSPQVWAWRKNRIKKIKKVVDRMAVILPFEEELYNNEGVNCMFVGHPIVEEIKSVINSELNDENKSTLIKDLRFNQETKETFKKNLGFNIHKKLISLLPGSRPKELERHLPLIIDVIRKFKNDSGIRVNDFQFCIPLAPNVQEKSFKIYLKTLENEGVIIKKGESVKVLCASDYGVITSGTATLQAAFLDVPIVVIYKLSPLSYYIGKLIIDVKHISLINILAKKEVVKELIQKDANSQNVINELKKIIYDEQYKDMIISEYENIKKPFLDKHASVMVVNIIDEMVSK